MKNLAISLFDFTLCMVYTQAGFFLSGVTYYWLLHACVAHPDGTWPGTPATWLMLIPALYLTWLLWFLLQCVIEAQVHRVWLQYHKIPRLNPADGVRSYLLFYATIFLYLRMRFVYSLPLVHALTPIPLLRHLVLRSYAMHDNLRRDSLILGLLYDPDLTEVGEGAIVGSGASVIGHSLTMNPDGVRILVTMPIRIGPRAVIGGGAAVHPGVVIGADAVIEPCSYVAPMTHVGDGEVWGGTPARFLRMRNADGAIATETHEVDIPLLADAEETSLRQIVARALHRPVEAISGSLSAEETSAWDSLAQLEISLGLHKQFGIRLSGQESFQLRSLSDLRAAIRRSGRV